jgi:hypothetical protein
MPESCPRCGSAKVVPNVPLMDHYGDMGHWSDQAKVEVHGKPKAWVFKDTAAGKLFADICGDCGHATLYVTNYEELYEAYRQARGE